MQIFLLVITLLLSPLSSGTNDKNIYLFNNIFEEKKFNQLIHETRCMVCQNQSLADSNTSLSHDLKNEIYLQIKQGKSIEEIKGYLVKRYGDYILYKPLVKDSTYLLWFGPLGIVILGLFIYINLFRRMNNN